MPTGYTACINSKPDITFRDFALQCARAFGACIEMRDDPIDRPPPQEVKVDDYHLNAINDAKAQLDRLEKMTPAERAAFTKNLQEDSKKQAQKSLNEKRTMRTRYNAMLERARNWKITSPDLQNLKDFMISQIEESIKFDCDEDYCHRELSRPEPEFEAFLEMARSDIKYHTVRYQEEVERTREKNEWLSSLYESLQTTS